MLNSGLDYECPTVFNSGLELNEVNTAIGTGNTRIDAQNVDATSAEGAGYIEMVSVDDYDEGHYLRPLPQTHLTSSKTAPDASDQFIERNAAVNSVLESSNDHDQDNHYQRHLTKTSAVNIPSGPYGNMFR